MSAKALPFSTYRFRQLESAQKVSLLLSCCTIHEALAFIKSLRMQVEAVFAELQGTEQYIDYEFKDYKGHSFVAVTYSSLQVYSRTPSQELHMVLLHGRTWSFQKSRKPTRRRSIRLLNRLKRLSLSRFTARSRSLRVLSIPGTVDIICIRCTENFGLHYFPHNY